MSFQLGSAYHSSCWFQGLDADAGRTRREQNQIKIRKQKRDEQRAKRRQITAAAPPVVPGSSINPPSLEDQQKAQQAEALQRMAQDPQTVRRLLANMTSQDDNLRLSATSQIRKLLSIGECLAWQQPSHVSLL